MCARRGGRPRLPGRREPARSRELTLAGQTGRLSHVSQSNDTLVNFSLIFPAKLYSVGADALVCPAGVSLPDRASLRSRDRRVVYPTSSRQSQR
jgi:hypothetical protein